ncbi:Hypp5635 [Branchiostoma lanceolatum]|uniref:Hypp5635 protein n=1 Tax=Branchiostoma lanceolatum TaxID=7740 RepID=A0A8J9VQX7_BRALA|nr:Hypp5635 [Branchiostoma lanceolatum]
MSFVMQCYWDKKVQKQYISQVMLCLDKQFGLLECDKYLSEGDLCWTTETIQYPPFQYDFNLRLHSLSFIVVIIIIIMVFPQMTPRGAK